MLYLKIGLALSGGGIRGVAHAGALKAFEDNKIPIDVIGGTSSGALISSLYALGYSPYYIYVLFKRYAKDIAKMNSTPILSGIGKMMMNKKDLIDVIMIAVLLSILVIFNCKLSADNSKKDNRINELEQQVEEQYYLIDALQQ